MCGIAGVIINDREVGLSLKMTIKENVKKMLDVIKHRGPDYSKVLDFHEVKNIPDQTPYFHVVFGHNRLSIIDLSPLGHQPMKDESGKYWIIHNGEIYNYLEVKKELKSLGYNFKSSTDTEVILKAYIEWGTESFKKFNGMWAFCIYDMDKTQIICSRDRLGIKPFYYYWAPGIFAFSSEEKQLLQLDFVVPKLNLNALADLLLWNFENHTDETFFEGIRKLPSGHYIVINRQTLNDGFLIEKYWDVSPKEINSPQEAIESFRNIFDNAVTLRLRSDVPIGITLSGGLDSSSILSFIAFRKNNLGEIKAFNVDYGIPGYGEKEYASVVAQKAGVELIILTPALENLVDEWEKFIWHIEQPIPGLSYYSNFKIYELIANHGIRVNLTGQGGDELLLGYERYRAFMIYFMLKKLQFLKAIREIIQSQKNGNLSFKFQLFQLFYFLFPKIRKGYRLKVISPYLKTKFVKEFSQKRMFHIVESTSVINWQELQLKEIKHYQLPHLLHHEDRMSMAHSIESRVPFLDYRLLELIQSLDMDMLYKDGYSKYILRQSAKGILPEKIRLRKDKKGYSTPTGLMIRKNKKYFMDLLYRNLNDPIINVKSVIENFDNQKLDERSLCNIVTYLSWKEIFNVEVEF